jgi:hypothetical protein
MAAPASLGGADDKHELFGTQAAFWGDFRLRHLSETISPVRLTSATVKVFGCHQAYENRPCTNPRGRGDRLWGFRSVLGCGDGETGAALEPAGAW